MEAMTCTIIEKFTIWTPHGFKQTNIKRQAAENQTLLYPVI